MPCELRKFKPFEHQLSNISKKYTNSTKSIEKQVNKLANNHGNGSRYPGFGDLEIRKTRLPLKAYGIGKSKGLRVITLYLPEKNIISPIVIYKKGKYGTENEVKELIRNTLKEILKELSA